jgi:hypothetical protein
VLGAHPEIAKGRWLVTGFNLNSPIHDTYLRAIDWDEVETARTAMSRRGRAATATRVRGGVFGEGEGKGCGGRIEASAATVSYGTAAAGVHAVVEECRRDLGLVGRD